MHRIMRSIIEYLEHYSKGEGNGTWDYNFQQQPLEFLFLNILFVRIVHITNTCMNIPKYKLKHSRQTLNCLNNQGIPCQLSKS